MWFCKVPWQKRCITMRLCVYCSPLRRYFHSENNIASLGVIRRWNVFSFLKSVSNSEVLEGDVSRPRGRSIWNQGTEIKKWPTFTQLVLFCESNPFRFLTYTRTLPADITYLARQKEKDLDSIPANFSAIGNDTQPQLRLALSNTIWHNQAQSTVIERNRASEHLKTLPWTAPKQQIQI